MIQLILANSSVIARVSWEILTATIAWPSEECAEEKQVRLGPVMEDTFFGMASLGITDDAAVVAAADNPTEAQSCGLISACSSSSSFSSSLSFLSGWPACWSH